MAYRELLNVLDVVPQAKEKKDSRMEDQLIEMLTAGDLNSNEITEYSCIG